MSERLNHGAILEEVVEGVVGDRYGVISKENGFNITSNTFKRTILRHIIVDAASESFDIEQLDEDYSRVIHVALH